MRVLTTLLINLGLERRQFTAAETERSERKLKMAIPRKDRISKGYHKKQSFVLNSANAFEIIAAAAKVSP